MIKRLKTINLIQLKKKIFKNLSYKKKFFLDLNNI